MSARVLLEKCKFWSTDSVFFGKFPANTELLMLQMGDD